MTKETIARPFIKWAGGKAKLIEQYAPYIPKEFERYHEPFLGGGAMFFHLAARIKAQGGTAYLSDLNPEIVNAYKVVRNDVEPLIKALAEHKANHDEDYYYEMRAKLESEPVARAARFIYLNKTCYNGLYRENMKGLFNVPVGKYKNPPICDATLLQIASEALQVAEISEDHFSKVLKKDPGAGDFVYFDPPYQPVKKNSFKAYIRYGFSEDAQEDLMMLTRELKTRGATVLASNSDCPFIRNLYEGFELKPITAARSINSKAKKRGKVKEVLVVA